ncbi:MAG: hypothetical protein IPJ27_05525 [Candidatus Accumulibacter sp.]|uniref:Uncharacterized protein n=1 Tax=Candidatus Accumulibacter proximus TaxID=2954385 RepID=A0A935UF51_9PROT|nr:hypothetical protein [Candidatus Accumulibacter proximus]
MNSKVATPVSQNFEFAPTEVGALRQQCPNSRARPKPSDVPGHRIEIELVDEQGQPVPGEEYCITDPDGCERRGYLDRNGFAREEGIKRAGECKISFPKLDKDAWRRA